MTRAVDVYELLSRSIEPRLAPHRPADRPELAFRRIGIAAVAGALAASRPAIVEQRPVLVEVAPVGRADGRR